MTNSLFKTTTTTTTASTDMEFYPDTFDNLDQDDEVDRNWNDKQIWEKIREEFNFDYKFDNTYDNMQEQDDEEFMVYLSDDAENERGDDDEETFGSKEENILPQQQNQLLSKKDGRTSIDDNQGTDLMPAYLLARNQLFDRMIQEIIHHTSPVDMDELRQMAFFRHQIAHFHHLHHLWSAYLRAGIGSLKDDKEEEQERDVSKQIDRRYWSEEVTSIVDEKNLNLTEVEDRHSACQDLVYKHLNEYREKIQLYEQQFNEKKEDLPYWTSTIDEAIQTFVQQYGILPLQMKYNHQRAILTCEYEDQILQRQYQQQNPTSSHKQIAHDFYAAESYLETIKNESIEYQERLRCNKPPASYDELNIPLPPSIHSITNEHTRRQLLNRYEKLLEQTKTDLFAIHLAVQQATIYQYQTLVNEKQSSTKDIPETLQNLLHQRSVTMKNKLKLIRDFTIHYYLHHSSYSQLEMMAMARTKRTGGFLSHLLVDSTLSGEHHHHLTERQLQLLNRGPTYTPPGQLHISSLSTYNETRDDRIKKQYAPLKHQIAILHNKYNTHVAKSMNFQVETFEVFENLYSLPLPSDIYQRAIYEKKLIRSVQDTLKENHLLLRRTADQQNTFYLGPMQDFIHLSNQYMENNTDTYSILFDLNEMTVQDVQQQLKTRYLALNAELDKLVQEKRLNSITHPKLRVKIERVKLPYLYFLPEISTVHSSLQVQPMISAHHSMTSKLAQFLKQIIRPLLLHDKSRTTWINEADFMKKLLSYATNQEHHLLSPTTLFATIKIMNFSTMASHESILRRLEYFLFDHTATNKVSYTTLKALNLLQSISVDTVKKLTDFYLKNNFFYYNGKIYQLNKGAGPTSLFLSELLSNIYLLSYDKQIYSSEKLKTEFYGRYKDQIFFTWNQSQAELKLFLDDTAKNYPGIHIQTTMGTCVQFFHAQIENRRGHLYTSVYHHSSTSKYNVPYVIDHVKSNHSLWFRSALIRAVRYCSNVYDFNQEQIYIVMSCLMHGYSIDFIHTQLKHFYLRFNLEKIIHCCPNQTIYEQLRHQLFDYIDVQRTRSDKYHELDDKEYIFHFFYPYDYGAYYQFHRKFQELWKKYYQEDCQLSHKDTQILLTPKSIYSLNTLLAQQKPSHELLKM